MCPLICLQVAAEYRLVHQAMAQPPVQDYVPASWTTLVHVKAEHFRGLAHYHAAAALCGASCECPPCPVCLCACRDACSPLTASLLPSSGRGRAPPI